MCPGQWVFVLFAEGLVFLVINLFGTVAKIIIIIISKIYLKCKRPTSNQSLLYNIIKRFQIYKQGQYINRLQS